VKRPLRFLVPLLSILVIAQRLPAPIVEEESPTPAPTGKTTPAPKRKPSPKPPAAESDQAKPRTERSDFASAQPTPRKKVAPYVGMWAGTMGITLFGNIGYTFLVDPSQTKVTMWGTNKPAELSQTKSDICPASIVADGISWSWSAWRWTLKPYPDGKTALVKVSGPFQSGSAIFERMKY
jgi:cell wall-associated NlpC family hydrolase